jgi:GNAT superfamily N-acetyltransferase
VPAGTLIPLRNGWEPDTPAGDTLARQALDAHIARATATAAATGAPWEADDDVVMADLSLPGLFGNHAMVRRPAGVERAVDRCEAFFAPGHPYLLWSPFPTGDLRSRGLDAVGHPPLMVRPAGSTGAAAPPELEVVAVTDAAGLAEFERTLVEAYPMEEWAGLPAGSVFPVGGLDSGRLRYWVGRVDGEPVATASSVSAAGVNLVEWVSCRPPHRGLGYGAALTEAAATAVSDQPAVLLASDDGRPVYERMGFLAVERWTLWTRRGSRGRR